MGWATRHRTATFAPMAHAHAFGNRRTARGTTNTDVASPDIARDLCARGEGAHVHGATDPSACRATADTVVEYVDPRGNCGPNAADEDSAGDVSIVIIAENAGRFGAAAHPDSGRGGVVAGRPRLPAAYLSHLARQIGSGLRFCVSAFGVVGGGEFAAVRRSIRERTLGLACRTMLFHASEATSRTHSGEEPQRGLSDRRCAHLVGECSPDARGEDPPALQPAVGFGLRGSRVQLKDFAPQPFSVEGEPH
mmetsp:Transcript_57660/g.160712  ORF Transcript_57660/g.160712 Transcript_57660/m.160712 type:complete len:250 (-) Transcript_57660:118-867(-)